MRNTDPTLFHEGVKCLDRLHWICS